MAVYLTYILFVLIINVESSVSVDSTEGNYASTWRNMETMIRNRNEILKTMDSKLLHQIGNVMDTSRLIKLVDEISTLLDKPDSIDFEDDLEDSGDAMAKPSLTTDKTNGTVPNLLNMFMKFLQGRGLMQGNTDIIGSVMSQVRGLDAETISGILKLAQPLLQMTGINDQPFGPVLSGILTNIARNPSILGLGSTKETNTSNCVVNNATQNNSNVTDSSTNSPNIANKCEPNTAPTGQSLIASVVGAATSFSTSFQSLPSQCRIDLMKMFGGMVRREGWALSSMYSFIL